MVFGIGEKAPPMFHPTKRLALLVQRIEKGRMYRQMSRVVRRNEKEQSGILHGMRCAFSGIIKTIKGGPITNNNDRRPENLLKELNAVKLSHFTLGSVHGFHYDHIAKIFPRQPSVRAAYGVLSFFSRIADKDTLTLVFINAHGDTQGIGDFKYKQLLDRLDKIAGKKVLIAMACHSGAAIDHIKRRTTAGDYAVIAAAPSKYWSTHCAASCIQDLLTQEIIKQGRPLASLLRFTGPVTKWLARIFSLPSYQFQTSVPYRARGSSVTAETLFFPFDVVL